MCHRAVGLAWHGKPMSASATTLPVEWQRALQDFATHLRLERSRSEHTVRAYVGDLTTIADFASNPTPGLSAARVPADLTLDLLRGWLAAMVHAGLSRRTVARRVAA